MHGEREPRCRRTPCSSRRRTSLQGSTIVTETRGRRAHRERRRVVWRVGSLSLSTSSLMHLCLCLVFKPALQSLGCRFKALCHLKKRLRQHHGPVACIMHDQGGWVTWAMASTEGWGAFPAMFCVRGRPSPLRHRPRPDAPARL